MDPGQWRNAGQDGKEDFRAKAVIFSKAEA